MRWGPALILSLAFLASASAQPAFPEKPIPRDERWGCQQYGFLESNACVVLAAASEPLLPITRRDTRLAFRLAWSRGGERRSQSIMMRVELRGPTKGFFALTQGGSGGGVAGEELTPDEVAAILNAVATAGFWSMPLTGGVPPTETLPGGIERINLCSNVFALSGVEAERRRVLQRACPTEKTDPALFSLVRTLIDTARHYRSWVAADRDFWPDMR